MFSCLVLHCLCTRVFSNLMFEVLQTNIDISLILYVKKEIYTQNNTIFPVTTNIRATKNRLDTETLIHRHTQRYTFKDIHTYIHRNTQTHTILTTYSHTYSHSNTPYSPHTHTHTYTETLKHIPYSPHTHTHTHTQTHTILTTYSHTYSHSNTYHTHHTHHILTHILTHILKD